MNKHFGFKLQEKHKKNSLKHLPRFRCTAWINLPIISPFEYHTNTLIGNQVKT